MIPTTLHPLTFRQFLASVPAADLAAALIAKDDESQPEVYAKVVTALLALPPCQPRCPILLSYYPADPALDDQEAVCVHLLNTAYIEPPAGLLPYYGAKGDEIPEGHYDATPDCYQETFGMGFSPWRGLVDAEIRFEHEPEVRRMVPTDAAIAAEILWELTFYGYSEAAQQAIWAEVIGIRDAYFESKSDGESSAG